MPQPDVRNAPLQHGLYNLLQISFPDRAAGLDGQLYALSRSPAYLYLRDHIATSAQAWVRSMRHGQLEEVFRQNAAALSPAERVPAVPVEEQVGLARLLWQASLLGEKRGDFYALTDYSYLSYLFGLEAAGGKRWPMEFERVLVESMRQLLRDDLSGGEAEELFRRLDGYTVRPTHSFGAACSLLTTLTTEMLAVGVRLMLRLPYTQLVPGLTA